MQSNPCQNGGECIAKVGGVQCKCLKNFNGDFCEYHNATRLTANKIMDSISLFLIVTLTLIFAILILILVLLWRLRTKIIGKFENNLHPKNNEIFFTNVKFPKTTKSNKVKSTIISIDEIMCSSCKSYNHLSHHCCCKIFIPPPSYSEVECDQNVATNEFKTICNTTNKFGSYSTLDTLNLEEQQNEINATRAADNINLKIEK